MNILLTGFGPFADVVENPSAAVSTAVGEAGVSGCAVRSVVLPVEYRAAARRLCEAVRAERPGWVICLGVARGRAVVEVERVARGGVSESLDNAGEAGPFVAEPPGLRTASIDVDGVVSSLRAGGHRVNASDDAGGYVCDHLFWTAVEVADEIGARAGFVHLPDPNGEAGANWSVGSLASCIRDAIAWLTSRDAELLADVTRPRFRKGGV